MECLTTVTDEDIDLLVLLLYHADVNSEPLYFKSSKKSNEIEIHNILHYKTILGSEVYPKLLFLSAFTGCDTASSIYGVGKVTAFKTLISNTHWQEVALVFTANSRSHEEIESAGNKAMSIIFKENTDQTLNSVRHKRLVDKIDIAKYFVKPEKLPPTESAAKYHSFRTYLQIIQWKGESNLLAVNWDWTVKSNKFIPVLTDLEAAPQSILKIIRCQCKTIVQVGDADDE